MPKRRNKRRLNKITVTARDNPTEYHRQYYWIAVKNKSKAPKKRK